MKPLEALKQFRNSQYQGVNVYADELLDIIETALKDYEELTSKPVIMCRRTHGEAQALIDTICKNYKEVKITCLEDEKKLKALEIIIAKRVDISYLLHTMKHDGLEDYNDDMKYETMYLTKEEYDLLTEVAEREGWLW